VSHGLVDHGGVDRTVTKLISLMSLLPENGQRARTCTRPPLRHLVLHTLRGPQYRLHYVSPYPDDGYVLVITCAFTRWVELYWCQDATAS
jgi:hypothetical protein